MPAASDGLGEREERDALAVRQAAAPQHAGLRSRTGEELLHQPRLPDARRTEEGEQVRGPFAHRVVEGAFEQLMLLRPPDHRRVEMTCVPFRSLEHAHEAVGSDALRLALQLERFDGLDLDRVLDQAICGIAEKNLSGRGRLLEAGGDVHRVAGHQALTARRIPGDDLAGVHADPRREPDAMVAFEVVVQRLERLPHAVRRPNRSERVVLVELGDPEHRHHGVADELLDRPAVSFDHR